MISLLTPYACFGLAMLLLRHTQGYTFPECVLAGAAWPVDLAFSLMAYTHDTLEFRTERPSRRFTGRKFALRFRVVYF